MTNPLLARALRLTKRRLDVPREATFDPTTRLLSWKAPAVASNVTHYRIRLGADASESDYEVSAGHRSMPIPAGVTKVFLSAYNSSTRAEGPKLELKLDDLVPEVPDVKLFRVGTALPNGKYDPTMFWDELRQRMIANWGVIAPDDRRNWSGVHLWLKRPVGGGYEYSGDRSPVHFLSFHRSEDGDYYHRDTVAFQSSDIPDPPEDWTFLAVSIDAQGRLKLDAEGKPTGKAVTLQTLPKWGQLADLAASVAEYYYDEATQPSKPLARVTVTWTNPPDASTDTKFDFWTYVTATSVTEPPDARNFESRGSKRWASDSAEHDIVVERAPAGGATKRYWIRAVVCGEYYSGPPDNTSPVCYVDVTAAGTPAQVTAFSVVRNDLNTPVKTFTVTINYTRPVDDDFWYSFVERIACDSDYTPLPGAEWEHFMEVGAYATPGVPTSELAVRDGHVYPTEAAEYWKMRARSVSRAGVTNDTNPPTSNLSVPTVDTIDGSVVVDIPTASFALGIKPLEVVASLPDLPNSKYPVGAVVVVYSTHVPYISLGSAWAVADPRTIVGYAAIGIVAAGAISTTELVTDELLVGRGGGKPTRFRVNDENGNMAAFLGDYDNTYLNWFRDIRIGPSMLSPNLKGSAAGLEVTDANIQVTGPGGMVLVINPNVGFSITLSPFRTELTGYTTFMERTDDPYTWSLLAAGRLDIKGASTTLATLAADASGGFLELVAASATKVTASAYGAYGPYIDVAGIYQVGGVTVIGSDRTGSFSQLLIGGAGCIDPYRNATFAALKYTGIFQPPYGVGDWTPGATAKAALLVCDASGVPYGVIPIY